MEDQEKTLHEYTIGKISEMYKIGPDSLRYYEEKGILMPERNKSGYRIYTDKDIWRLNVIKQLRELGIPVETIHSFFTKQSIENTVDILTETLNLIAEKQEVLNRISQTVREELSAIEDARSLNIGNVVVKKIPRRYAFVIHKQFSLDEEMDMLMKELVEKSESHIRLIGNNRIAAILAPLKSRYIYKSALIFDPKGTSAVAGGQYLSICYAGEADSRTYAEELMHYAEDHGLKLDGPMIEIVWIDIHSTHRLEEHITEVQVKVRKA